MAMSVEKPKKVMTKVPSNFEELSEEERKEWVREASRAIVESLKDTPTRGKADS
jgi:hypothetical protein